MLFPAVFCKMGFAVLLGEQGGTGSSTRTLVEWWGRLVLYKLCGYHSDFWALLVISSSIHYHKLPWPSLYVNLDTSMERKWSLVNSLDSHPFPLWPVMWLGFGPTSQMYEVVSTVLRVSPNYPV